MTTIDLYDDPAAFLHEVRDHLAQDPVLTTVVASVAAREVAEGLLAAPGLPHWYAVTRDAAGGVTGVAMRTAPFAPHPLFVLPMPDAAAVALARLLHERGEHVGGANGALPAVRVLVDETARLGGGTVRVRMHTRLFELREVREPPRPAGRLRTATQADLDIALAWFEAFHRDADEQAGREGGHEAEAVTLEAVQSRVEHGHVFLWEVDGEPVHLTGRNPASYGAARIGPVYTPRAHRGRGYASATVAELSRRILEEGDRPCLFTDQANPVSNRVYERIGYEKVVDMVNLLVQQGDN